MCACQSSNNNKLVSSIVLFNVILIIYSFNYVNCYNVDVVNFAKYTMHQKSMFGFTVALHKEANSNWVLVGAPEAQTNQYNVTRGGSVFRCTTTDDRCQEVPFDSKGNTVSSDGKVIDDKSYQWFGATLHSGGRDKPIVACAPRYIWFTHKNERRDPVGTCYVAKSDFREFSEYSPCRTNQWGYHRQGSCQAGFSAAISDSGKRLFVGAPGSWYWQGQVFSIDAYAQFPYSPGVFGHAAFGSGKVIQQSLENRPAVLSTHEGSAKDDDSYLGYSMTVGDFYDEGEQGTAVGMPRGNHLLGKVVLYSWNLSTHQNISGTQLGAYFGYAIASADLDGDTKDDLIVGAPMYTVPNNEGKFEMGRVYVIYQKSSMGPYRRVHVLDGKLSRARFGLSLCRLGDINLDGYEDFAVGAPYDGPDNRGAVYIYHGSDDGVRLKHSQMITAEEIGRSIGRTLETFGFSLTGGMDLDGNDYPDMAVGSYLSDTALFFRSRPVVKIEAFARFASANKEIIMEERNCTLINGQRVPCTVLDFCIRYFGLGIPSRLDLDLHYTLDVKKPKDPRMFFMSETGKNTFKETITLYHNQPITCRSRQVYIKNDIRDKLTSIDAEIKYSMRYIDSYPYQTRDPQAQLLPVLDLNLPPSRKDSISIHKNCGDDNICVPNLGLIVKPNVDRYLLGSKDILAFDVIVKNDGEDSFESTFDLELPSGVDFINVAQSNKTEIRILCSPAPNNTIRCDIGNPLPGRTIVRFTMQMKPRQKEGMKPSFDFYMSVNSTNEEHNDTVNDNRVHVPIPIWVDSKLELGGTSKPTELYYYNLSSYKAEKIVRESDIGPAVTHVYSIRNNGPSDIKEAEIFLVWPYATMDGKDLLYLLEQHMLGNVKCDASGVNYKGYELEFRRKSIWETLKIDATSKGDFGETASHAGGILIEEGTQTHGISSFELEKRLKNQNQRPDTVDKSSGDASFVHLEREKGVSTNGGVASGSGAVDGTVVHVGEDTGSGSKVDTVKTHVTWTNTSTSTGPVITHTYSKNTTYYIGPDGKRVEVVHTSEDGRENTQVHSSGDFSRAGSTWQQTGDGRIHSQTDYQTQTGARRPQPTHTTSVEQRYRPGDGQFSSTHVTPLGYEEEAYHRRPPPSASATPSSSPDGAPIYREEAYPGSRPTAPPSRHFSWNGNQQSGSGHRDDYYERDQHRYSSENRGGHSEESRGGSGGGAGSGYSGERHGAGYAGERHGSTYRQRQEGSYGTRDGQNTGYQTGQRVDGQGQQTGGGYNHSYRTEWSAQGNRDGGGAGGQRDRTTYGKYDGATTGEDYAEGGLGAAAIGHGFHTATLDLGTLGNSNALDNRNILEAHTVHYDPDSGKFVEGSSSVGRGSSATYGTSNEQTYESSVEGYASAGTDRQHQYYDGAGQSGDGGRRYESHHHQYRWSSQPPANGNQQQQQQRDIDRDNVHTDKPETYNRFHGRRKREIPDASDATIERLLTCKSAKCFVMRCTVGPLPNDKEAFVALRFRANVKTIQNITITQPIELSSMMVSRISKLPYIGKPVETAIHSHEISTKIPALKPDGQPVVVQLWVVVLSAMAGAIILLLLIYVFYKCGFFKRNRPSDAPERQPLNRNGYHSGDEAL